jgi:hypothetical protein
MPIEKLENGPWLHASRLPLGGGWSGHCTAPGHENEAPSQEELRDFCNLGYAESCARLPRERIWDSVRFAARALSCGPKSSTSKRIQLHYVCERGHRPVEHGFLEFNAADGQWAKRHADSRVQRMAECFLAAYLDKRRREREPVAS